MKDEGLNSPRMTRLGPIYLSVLLLIITSAVPMGLLSLGSSPLDENEQPVANAGEDITSVYLNDVVMLNGTLSTDDDIDNCTWIWESSTHPDIEVAPENSSTPSFTVNVEQTTITFTLTLRDPTGLESSDDVDITVEENSAPRVTIASPPASGSEGPFYEISRPIEFSANGTVDTESSIDDLDFSWSSNISGVIGNQRFFTDHLDELGWHEITLEVSDPNGGVSSDVINIKVREDPFAPEGSIFIKPTRPDLRFSKAELVTFDASLTSDDNSFDTLDTMNFTWSTNLSGGMILGYGYKLEVYLEEGFHNISLEVVDTDGLRDDVFVHLESYNLPPEATVEAPGVKLRGSVPTVNESETVEFTGIYSSDPDEDELAFKWDLGDGEMAVGETITYSWARWGTYNISLTVNDGSISNNLDMVNFSISVNSIPVAAMDLGISVEVGENFEITANGSYDDDGDELTYRWDFDNDGRFDSSQNRTSWRFNQEGVYTVLLRVSDGFAYDEITSEVEVFFPNAAPMARIANELIDEEIVVPLSGGRGEVELDASPSLDPDDDTNGNGEIDEREENNLTYTWDLDITDDSDNDGIEDNDVDDKGDTVTVKLTDSSVLRVKLNVSDPRGSFDTMEITLRGNHPPDSLSIRVGPATKVLVGAQVTFTASARDEDRTDRNKLEYYWDYGDGEQSTGISFQGRHTYRKEGTYEVTLTVSDTQLESSTVTSITVVEMDPPQISFPANGSEVSGTVTLNGRIRELRNFEVNKVEVKVGSRDWKTAEGTTQWTYSFNSENLPNGDLEIIIRYTVDDVEPITSQLYLVVDVQNEPPEGFDWLPVIVGGVILLVLLGVLFLLFRRKPRRWEQILPPPGPGQRMPPMVPPGGLPPATTRSSLPPAAGQIPPKKEAPQQSEPPEPEEKKEEGPKQIRIKCPACTKVFKVTDSGERPLHINCKHCGAKGTIDEVPGSDEGSDEDEKEKETEDEQASPEPIPIVCPSCDNLFELDEVTDTAKCPICGAEGELDEGTISLLQERFGDAAANEEITLKCPSCAGTFKVKGSDSSIICPFCGAKGKPSG